MTADNLPVLFIGIVQFALLISFFMNGEIKARKRIVSGILCLIFFFSFQLSTLNIMWHGFSINNWFNYRYSFIAGFFLLLLSYDGYIHFPAGKKYFFGTCAAFIALSGIAFISGRENMSVSLLITDIAMALISLFIVRNMRSGAKGRKKKTYFFNVLYQL